MKRLFLLSALLALLTRGAEATTCSSTTFITAATYPAPAPSAVVVADFNGDGFLDIVAAPYNGTSLSVILNNGDGTFGNPIVTNVGYFFYGIAAADLRGNGHADLVVTVYSGLAVLLGNGDGSFASPVVYPSVGYNPIAVVVGKFDAGDTLDAVVVDQSGSNLDVFPGNGDGTFGAPKSSPASGLLAITSGDFNGDGKLDLVGTNPNAGLVSFYPGAGDGTFGAPSSFIAGSQPTGITSGDFDGDGRPDVATTSGSFVSVLLGNGNGTFQAALLYPAGSSPVGVQTADFDANGTLDLAVVDPNGQTVSLLFGSGDGTFGAPASYMGGSQLSGLAVGDLDGDALPDVVTGNEVDAVVVLRNGGAGQLVAVPSTNLSGPYGNNGTPSVAVGDWDGDGRQDLAWASQSQLNVVRSVGGGRFEQVQALATEPFPQGLNGAASGEFTGDGRADLVTTDFNDVILFPGLGDGTFGAAQTVYSPGSVGVATAADFTGDARDDIAVSQNCCGSQTILVLPGNGDGTFQPAIQTVVGLDAGNLQPVDLNGDGRPDLLVTSSSAVYILISNGDGTFRTPVMLASHGGCCYSYWAAPGRFGGGATDVLVSDTSASVSIYPGNGDGTFGTPVQVALPTSGGAVSTGDYDGDGHDDFAVMSGNQTVLVFAGLGNRRFQTPVAYPTATYAAALVSGYFAGSGRLDIAAAGQYATSTLVNAGLGATLPPAVSTLVGAPAILTAAASGYGPVSYQWRKGGTPVVDGGPISGATTSVLRIDPADFGDAGSYDVVVTDSCATTPSNATTLAVEFADVPVSNIFHNGIITIATAGVTAGCGGSSYCPTGLVSRAQMAVFLLKSEHGSTYVPPGCVGLFADVPCPAVPADWIEQLANEHVTAGCGGGDYCPDASVTRAQMAIFLLKTSQGSGYAPPSAVGIFGDVPAGSFGADYIEDLHNRGIAGGCSASPLLYCPDSAVNRGQMAAFLVHTFFGP